MNTSFLDQLNLTPQERRIVVVIAVVVFVVLNLLLVWPHFGDLARVRHDLEETRQTMRDWNAEISKDLDPSTNGYKNKLKALQHEQGGGIVSQQIQLQKSVYEQAMKTGVNVSDYHSVGSTAEVTNEFYEEQSLKITFECQETQLINFLFNVGNDPAMIRVRELSLRPADANRYGLRGDAFLSANYAKQPQKAAPAVKTTPQTAPPAVAPKTAPGDKSLPAPKPAVNPRPAPGAQSPTKNL
jgi:Tfp pilus assembly protein PilO